MMLRNKMIFRTNHNDWLSGIGLIIKECEIENVAVKRR